MKNEKLQEKINNSLVGASFLYNMTLLLFFTILMLVIQEWYILIMLLLSDRHCFSSPPKNIENSGDRVN